MPLEIQKAERPRNDYDDAFDYLAETDTGWAQVVIPEDDVRKTKRGLTAAAKEHGRKLKYEESAVSKDGKVTLTIGLRPVRETADDDNAESVAPGAAPTVPEV